MTVILVTLSLQDCAIRLREDLAHQAPALITLKRWSASGALDKAKVVSEGGTRPKYKYSVVLDIAKNTFRRKPSEPRKPSHAGIPLPTHSARRLEAFTTSNPVQTRVEPVVDINTIADTVNLNHLSKAVADELKPILAQALQVVQKQMLDGLANLDATRKSLMLRYDTEIHTMRERMTEVLAENKRLSAQALDAARINGQLARLNDKFDALPSNSGELK